MRETLSRRMGMTEALALYEKIRTPDAFSNFALYLFDDDCLVARNAAWVMTQSTNNELLWLLSQQNDLIDLVLATENISLRRLVLNLLERMPFNAETLRSDFLDFCLDHMQSLLDPPGVQSLCMKLAYKQCQLYPELQDELIRTLQTIEPMYYQPGLRSILNRILTGRFHY